MDGGRTRSFLMRRALRLNTLGVSWFDEDNVCSRCDFDGDGKLRGASEKVEWVPILLEGRFGRR